MSFLASWRLGGSILFLITATAGCGNLTPATNPAGDGSGSGSGVRWNSSSTEVASVPGIQLAPNGTGAGGRDSLAGLHLVFADGLTVSQGLLGTTISNWIIKPVPKLNGDSQVTQATFAIVNDQLMFAAWVERRGDQRSIVISRSLNVGNTFQAPLLIAQGNLDDVVSLCAFTRSDSTSGAVLAWFDASLNRTVASAWRGLIWAASDWTLPVVLASGSVSRHVSVAASGSTVIAVWEDTRSNPSGDLFLAKSINGGLNWNLDAPIGVPLGASAQGQFPSIALRTSARVYVAYQNAGNVYLRKSTNGASTFGSASLLGPGRFGHVAVNTNAALAVAWEHTTSDPADNTNKTLGLTVSLDDGITLIGPHNLPVSDKVFNVVQPSVTLSDKDLDVFWVDVGDPRTNVLRHQNAQLP